MQHSALFPARVAPKETTRQLFDIPAYGSVTEALSSYDGDDHIYALYPEKIAGKAQEFISGLNGKSLYAVKANPHPAVLKILWAAGITNFDVASMREVELVAATLPSARMYLMHPVKSRGLIARAYELGVRDFSFDHADELQKILDCTGEAADLGLHLRLALPKGEAKIPLGGKFGAGLEDGKVLLQRARKVAARLGVCFHVGSQNLNPAAYDSALAYARTIVDASGVQIDSMDVGGGFPVDYPDMPVRDLGVYFDAIHNGLKAHGFDHLELLAEPGRALVAEGGSTLARVELRKGNDLYLNDGIFGSLFDAGMFAWKYPLALHRSRPPAPMKREENFRFFGPTCDSHDTLNGPFALPADTSEGDWVEIGHLGAYGYGIAARFNGFYSETVIAISPTI